ncbi:MAG: APC family permease, partial [Actinobacteria bacterium]|nr:APC family permease [Actinomycetota bacterium]
MSNDLSPPGAQQEFKRSLSLTGVTVNGMALIAPGAFLWTTFQEQAAQTNHGVATGNQMWTGLVFAFVLAMFTAWSYSQLAKIYPNAGTGSTYYFAEAAFLDKKAAGHRRLARPAKLAFGWISHLYYWIYPGIMIAFIATIVGYIYSELNHGAQLGWPVLSAIAIVSALLVGYVAYRGISGSTMVALGINVVQIVTLVAISAIFIAYRLIHPGVGYVQPNAGGVLLPHNFINLLYQSTIAILLLVGFESITSL